MNTDEDLCTTVSFFKALKRQTVASIPDAADGVNYPAALSVTALTPAIEYLHAFPWKKTSFNCEYHSSNHRFSSIVLNMKNPQVKNFAFKSSLGENLKSAQIKDKKKKKNGSLSPQDTPTFIREIKYGIIFGTKRLKTFSFFPLWYPILTKHSRHQLSTDVPQQTERVSGF